MAQAQRIEVGPPAAPLVLGHAPSQGRRRAPAVPVVPPGDGAALRAPPAGRPAACGLCRGLVQIEVLKEVGRDARDRRQRRVGGRTDGRRPRGGAQGEGRQRGGLARRTPLRAHLPDRRDHLFPAAGRDHAHDARHALLGVGPRRGIVRAPVAPEDEEAPQALGVVDREGLPAGRVGHGPRRAAGVAERLGLRGGLHAPQISSRSEVRAPRQPSAHLCFFPVRSARTSLAVEVHYGICTGPVF